tara:strand:- start:1484 stop:1801 length:318 start_codon:yes stop_codon:yes gene_type:complete
MSNEKECTQDRIEEALKMIGGAREDVKKYWHGNKHARESVDEQLSIAESRIDILTNLINLRVIRAKYEGRLAGLERGRQIYNDVYGSTYGFTKDQLQAGEGNLSL